jgi:hypothetical protein
MQISSNFQTSTTTLSTDSSSNEKTLFSQEYLKVMNDLYPRVEYQTRDEINNGDTELVKFKENLKTKSPAELLKDLNEEKINAIIDRYREKLQKEQKAHPEKLMDIDKMVSDFKKRLMKALEEAQKAEQELKDATKPTTPSTSDILSKVKISQETDKKTDNVLGFLQQLLHQEEKAKYQE